MMPLRHLMSICVLVVSLMVMVLTAPGPACAGADAAKDDPGKGRAEHVLIISIDGLRPDAIEAAGAPHLQDLIRKGAWCPKAETVRPSVTLPSHTSMLTGLDIKRHGVTWNTFIPAKGFIEHPTVMSLAKDSGRTTAMFYSKDKFYHLARTGTLDLLVGDTPQQAVPDDSAAGLAKAFAVEWPKRNYALTFVHLREPDSAGHSKGWMTAPYLEAVLQADAAVGSMVETLRGAGRLERTALIVTSDHGGSGKNHGLDIPENTTIPWICVGPGVKPGLKIDRIVRTYDTAPTALAFLGIAIPEGLDGKVVGEVMGGSEK